MNHASRIVFVAPHKHNDTESYVSILYEHLRLATVVVEYNGWQNKIPVVIVITLGIV